MKKKILNFIKDKIFKLSYKVFPSYVYKTTYLPNQIAPNLSREIPNIVYQTWVSKSLPLKLAREIKKFRELNNDFSFQIFTNLERDQYMKQFWSKSKIYEIYKNAIFEPCKTDIFRYCIIYERGGYYFDIKSGCHLPLSQLKSSNGAIISHEASYCICPPIIKFINTTEYPFNLIENWSFAFKPKHPFLELLINSIINIAPFIQGKIFSNPKNGILLFTGPGMMTNVLRNYNSITNRPIKPFGLDLNGKGIYSLKGASLRFKFSSSYADVRDSVILK